MGSTPTKPNPPTNPDPNNPSPFPPQNPPPTPAIETDDEIDKAAQEHQKKVPKRFKDTQGHPGAQ
jgi:hypothetical protein